jgi:hypothetical protein
VNFLNVRLGRSDKSVIDDERLAEKSDREQFDRIYDMAGLAQNGVKYTVTKLASLISSSKYLRSQPAQTKSTAVLVALEAANTTVEEIIEDASQRERVLDTYESVQQKALEEFESRKTKHNRELQAEMEAKISDCNNKIQANAADVSRARESFTAWQGRKHQEVARLRETVSLCRVSSRTESTLEATLDLIKSSRSVNQAVG